ncbi:MAG: RloB domain-containing protein [Clostridia bacterium]|nr:RloB domain-containing protein [Clostridia bacterium]
MDKKESRHFNISVEGINCETLYFEHLAKLINSSGRNTYNLKIDPKKVSPLDYARRNAFKPNERRKKNQQKLPYIHIQDIEDYYDSFQREKFYAVIDEMRKAEDQFGISYQLGYSNYTFELWMLLHVAEMNHAVQDRRAYLKWVNRWFHRNFANLDEFKQHDNFQAILDEYVTLDSIQLAIQRAENIVKKNEEDRKTRETYHGFTFYRDNPDISVHEVVQLILEVCDIR